MSFERRIKTILQRYGCLNTMEICRIVNGLGKDDYVKCSLSFKEKPFRSGPISEEPYHSCQNRRNKCKIYYTEVRRLLLKQPDVFTVKRLFWDHNRIDRKVDFFRFWFLDKQAYEDRIGKQTLDPHLVEAQK